VLVTTPHGPRPSAHLLIQLDLTRWCFSQVSSNRAASIAAKLPGCLSRMVPACGHLPHEEAPAAVVSLLTKFLSDTMGVLLAPVPEQPDVVSAGEDSDAA